MTPTPLLAILHTPIGRIRLALFILCGFVLFITFESIRRTKLKERYALLWVVPCLVLIGLTAFPKVLDWMQKTFGMTYASCMSAVVFVSLLVAVFVLSGAISANERALSRIAQRCASLEARIRELERGGRDARPPTRGGSGAR